MNIFARGIMKRSWQLDVWATFLIAFFLIPLPSKAASDMVVGTMSCKFGPPVAVSTWQKFTISLDAKTFGVNQDDFDQIMSNVKLFRIRMEMSDAKDVAGLDSICIGNVYVSDFTNGTEGWTCQGDGTLEWRPGAGKPGGYLQISDWGTGDWHWAVAPLEWSGNWSALKGKSISFYCKTDHPDYAGLIEISSNASKRLTIMAEPLIVPVGGKSTMRVGLNEVAASDVIVALSSSNEECLKVPEYVTIRRGEQDIVFSVVTTSYSTAGCSSVITASAEGYALTRMTLFVGKSSDMFKNGVLEGRVTDALHGNGLEGAIVTIAGLSDTTDANGRYRITNIPTNRINADFTAEPRSGKAPLTVHFYDLSDVGHYIASAYKEGYYRSETILTFYEGEIKYIDFSLSPVISPGEYRLVLNWGATPKDLDLHVITPEIDGRSYEISWENKGSGVSVPFVNLDIDRQDGFGPETITIKKLYPGTYRCFVENYSVTPAITNSYAVVQVYGSEGLLRTINIPTTGSGTFWRVCDINGSTGAITVHNTISNTPVSGAALSKAPSLKPQATNTALSGVVSWAWDFESDGIVDATVQNPVHTYKTPGYYSVTLKVSDGTQDFVITKENYISVQPNIYTDVAWRQQTSNVTNDLYAVFAVDTLNAWVGGSGGCMLRTTNGGQTWTPYFTYPQFIIYDIFFINPSTGWAVGSDTKQNAVILKSDNGGITWTRWPSSTNAKLFANYMVTPTTGFNCGQDGKIEKTIDGGASWLMQYTSLNSTLRGIYFLNSDFGWAVGDQGVVLKTINGGANWVLQTSGTASQINDVFFINELFGWAVTSDGKVLTTANGGSTWAQKQVSENALHAVHFENTYFGFVVGANGRIYKTIDAGTSWTLGMSGTGQHLHALHIVSSSCAWAVGNGGTILRLQRGAKIPQPVTNLYATAMGPNRIHLSWNNPSDEDFAGTVIQRKLESYPQSIGDGIRIYNGKSNTFTDTGLSPNTTYYYTAFAYNTSAFYSNIGPTSRAFASTPAAIALYGYNVTIGSIDASTFPVVKTFVTVIDSASLTPVMGLTAANFSVKENGYVQSPITVETVNITSGAKADIVFVFDTTGSMGGEINDLKARASAFADALAAKGIDYRLALITFGDTVDKVYDFTNDISIFKGWIESLRAYGGGDVKENALEGLARASKLDFRTITQRIAILITDAPYHQAGETGGGGTTEYTTESIIALLKEHRILTNVVGPDQPQFHQIADGTGGLFFNITGDFQAIIDRLGTVLSSQYVITYSSSNPKRDNTWRNVFLSAVKGDKGGYDTGQYFVSGEIQNVSSFYATAISYDRVYCRWMNPNFPGFAGVKIVRKMGSYPTDWRDGSLIYEGTAISCLDVGLVPMTVYYYRAFAFDNSGQVAMPTESAQAVVRTLPFWSTNTTWTAQNSGGKNDLYAVTATDTAHVWVGGSNGAHLRSMNGGLTWEPRFVSENSDVFDLAFINHNTGWLVGHENKSTALNMKTNSAGWSWTKWPSSADRSLLANAMMNERIGWNVGLNGHIEKTMDGGAHWLQQYHNAEQAFRDVAFVDSLTGWVVGDNGVILKTGNGGSTWSAQNSTIHSRINGVCFVDRENGWAVTSDGKVLSTKNGGSTWNVRSLSETYLSDVHFCDPMNGCIVGSLGHIYRTRDGGNNWNLEPSGILFTLHAVYLVSPICGWAVGDGGTILRLSASGTSLSGMKVTVNAITGESFPTIKCFVSVLDAVSRTSIVDLRANHFTVREDNALQAPLTVESLTSTAGAKADIVFVFDVTGSMGDEIEGLKNRAVSFADALASKGINYQLALITFKDDVDVVRDFTTDVLEFKTWMEELTAAGGGDVKENALEALARATRLSFRSNSQKMAILITDAEYHQAGESGDGTTSYTTDSIISLLRDQNMITHVVGPDLPQFQTLAEKTSGLWFSILSDFSGIIDSISGIIAAQYVITYTTTRPTADNNWRQVAVVVEKDGKGGFDLGKYFVGASSLVIKPNTILGIRDNLFEVSIDIENIINLGLVHFILTYNKDKVRLQDFSSGEFLSQGGAGSSTLIATNDTTNGTLDVTMTRVGMTSGANGTGTLLKARFKVLVNDCASNLGLTSVDLRTPDNAAIPVTMRGAYIQAAATAGLVGDFDGDLDIDLRDFTLLSSYWQPVNNPKGDIGPASGSPPSLIPIPDGKVNYEDLFVFTRMWNWYQTRSLSASTSNGGEAILSWQLTPVSMQDGVYVCQLMGQVRGMAMARLQLHYNSDELSLKEITPGPLLQLNDKTLAFFTDENKETGTVDVAIAVLGNGANQEVAGNGSILSLKVQLKTPQEANAKLALQNLQIFDRHLRALTVQKTELEIIQNKGIPTKFELSQNYPNPFNGSTEVYFRLPQTSKVKLTVLNVLGQPVRTLVDEKLPAGSYRRTWDGRNESGQEVVSGVYLLKMEAGSFCEFRRMAYVK